MCYSLSLKSLIKMAMFSLCHLGLTNVKNNYAERGVEYV